MTDPTPQDLANATARQIIADRQNAEYAEAQRLALGALGPGYTPWMKLVLIDADHRQSGNTTPVATVYKVYCGEERLTENSVFIRRMPDGQVAKADSFEPLFGELLTMKHPTRTVEVRGEQVQVGKYELCWASLELYHPKSAEQLAAARKQREEKAVERAAGDNPLFADQIRSGEWRPEKPKGRSPG
jgi:hypothetical protein